MKAIETICAGALALGLTGCGLESFAIEAGSDDHEPVVSTISGALGNQATAVAFTRPDGEAVALVDQRVTAGRYAIDLPGEDVYVNGRLTATDSASTYMALIPRIESRVSVTGVDLDARSTAAVLVVDHMLTTDDTTLQVVDDCVLGSVLDDLDAAMDDDGPAAEVLATVEAGDDAPDDATLAAAAEGLSLQGILDTENIRVVFEVDFNAGRLNGVGQAINRFKWVRDEPGKQMYFVGGLHEESPVQDAELSAMLGDTGSWTPNQVPMYDDGTHGDDTAGDNVWTVTFDLPRGARLGYKYTWGNQGDLWSGTEEWPGNQRLLEVVDVNGDDFVRRRDNFGDEATNKDLANQNAAGLLRAGINQVTWDTDLNGDEIPDARERPLDLDHDGTLDEWVTPTAIGPKTVACE